MCWGQGLGDRLSSNDVREYLLKGNEHPHWLFPECFSEEPPVAAITYEWRLSFADILSYLNPAQACRAAPRCASKWRCKWGVTRHEGKWAQCEYLRRSSANSVGGFGGGGRGVGWRVLADSELLQEMGLQHSERHGQVCGYTSDVSHTHD